VTDYNLVIHRTDLHGDGLLLLQKGSMYAIVWELDKVEDEPWFEMDELITIGMTFARGGDSMLAAADMATFIRDHVGEERWALYVLENM